MVKNRIIKCKDAESIKGEPFPDNKRDKGKTKRKKDG